MPKHTVLPHGVTMPISGAEPSLKQKIADSVDTLTAAKTLKILDTEGPYPSPSADAIGASIANTANAMAVMSGTVTNTYKGMTELSQAQAEAERHARNDAESRLQAEQQARDAIVQRVAQTEAEKADRALAAQAKYQEMVMGMMEKFMSVAVDREKDKHEQALQLAAERAEHTERLYQMILQEKEQKITELEHAVYNRPPSLEERLFKELVGAKDGNLVNALVSLAGGSDQRDPDKEYKIYQIDALKRKAQREERNEDKIAEAEVKMKEEISGGVKKVLSIAERVAGQLTGIEPDDSALPKDPPYTGEDDTDA